MSPSSLFAAQNRLVLSATVSGLGSSTTRFGLVLYIYDLSDNNAAYLGLAYLFSLVPAAILTPLGGLLAERVELRRLLVVGDLAFVPMVLLLPFLPSVELVLVGMFLTSGLASLLEPCFMTALPKVAERDDLERLNGWLASGAALIHIVSPLIAGIVYAATKSIWGIVILDAVSYAISAALVASVPRIPPVGSSTERRSAARDLLAGFSYVVGQRRLLFIILVIFVSQFFGDGLFVPLIMPFVNDVLGAGEGVYGYVMASFGVGAVVGGMLGATFLKRLGLRRLVFYTALVEALAALAFATTSNPWLAYGCVFIWGIHKMMLLPTAAAFVQKNAAPEFLGRAISIYQLRRVLPIGLGALIVATMGEKVPVSVALWSAGLGFVALALLLQLAGWRVLRDPSGAGSER